MIQKQKIVRLKGKAMRELVDKVYIRDNHSCVVCGCYVPDGVKPHHHPGGAGRKSDELGKMVLLCMDCHYQVHHGLRSAETKETIDTYLENIKNG